MEIVFATRPSTLARWQTSWVIGELEQVWPGLVCREKVITTSGDRILDKPLPEIGGKGLFTQELESEILNGQVQAAVHSLKDLPIEAVSGISIVAIPAREDVRDVLISARGYTLDGLPEGAHVGTSSLRRSAQLLACRPDLQLEPIRGNVDTRLRKAMDGQYDAIVLAGAGLKRLGLESHASQWLPLEWMLPAPGQGALAVQCRSSNAQVIEKLTALEDPASRTATSAERSFLTGLGGGCAIPVAAYADAGAGEIYLRGLVASPDGARVIRVQGRGRDAQALGAELARQALSIGADDILSSISAPTNR